MARRGKAETASGLPPRVARWPRYHVAMRREAVGKRGWLTLGLLVASAAAADACSSFGTDSGQDTSDAGPDSSPSPSPSPSPDSATVSPDATGEVDAGTLGDGGPDGSAGDAALRPPCIADPRPLVDQRRPDILWTPSDPTVEVEFPFQIDTDDEAVFWIAQPLPAPLLTDPDGGSALSAAYNGHGNGRIRRALKAEPGQSEVLVDNLPLARAMVLDGEYVYWATREPLSAIVYRAPRNCTAPCTSSTSVVTNLGAARVLRMYRVRPGLLALQINDTEVRLLETATPPATPLVTTPSFANLASGNGDVFVSAELSSVVRRYSGATGAQIGDPWSTIPDAGGARPGFSAIATNCTEVFGARDDRSLWRSDGGIFSFLLESGVAASDMAADDRYVFLAAFNAGGVYAVDLRTTTQRPLHSGNVWNLSADRDGVYWGEHEPSERAGEIYWMKR